MVTRKLRVALVGLGFGCRVIEDYRAAPELELALLCDVDEAKARRVSAEFGGIPATTRFEDCLAAGIDIVDVSTPNHLHAAQAVAALEAGKHVYLQKPMAPTVADCRRIVEAGRRAGRAVGMFMSSLGDPVNQELRAMVAAGAFGRVISVRGRTAHRGAHTSWKTWGRPADYWRRKKELTGGGGMALIGIHAINLMPWLAGNPVESVTAVSDNLASREIMDGDDITVAVTRLQGGTVATLEASYASENNAVEIYGTAGYAVRQGGALRLRIDAPWKGRMLEVPGGEKELCLGADDLERLGAPLRAGCEQHSAFARAILAGGPPPVSGEDGLRDVAVLEAIYRSAGSGRAETPEQ
jgi:predicted dehydrogenase